MISRQVEQGALFYNFSIDAHVPTDHLLRSIDLSFPKIISVRIDDEDPTERVWR